jgi:hypothetical protein
MTISFQKLVAALCSESILEIASEMLGRWEIKCRFNIFFFDALLELLRANSIPMDNSTLISLEASRSKTKHSIIIAFATITRAQSRQGSTLVGCWCS